MANVKKRYEVRFTMVGGDQITHVITATPRELRKSFYKARRGRTLWFDNPDGAWLVFCDKAIEIRFKELSEK